MIHKIERHRKTYDTQNRKTSILCINRKTYDTQNRKTSILCINRKTYDTQNRKTSMIHKIERHMKDMCMPSTALTLAALWGGYDE